MQEHLVAIRHVRCVLDNLGIRRKPPLSDNGWFAYVEFKLAAYLRWWLAKHHPVGKCFVHGIVQFNDAWI